MNPLDAVKFDEIILEDVKKLQEYADRKSTRLNSSHRT